MVRVWFAVIALAASLVFAGWASDFITMQGERTVYTVACVGGAWEGDRCAGRVDAGPRYRYRALKPHGEVVFWTLGTQEPSGKFDKCVIQDGRNWLCPICPDATRSITLQMAEGLPVPGPEAVTRPFRAVSKWRWMLLKRGFTEHADVPTTRLPVATL